MKHLTAHDCSSAPRLIAYSQMKQPEGMCLPGGYLVCILMELVPGKMIMDFWDYDRETRDRIRTAFKKSWLCVTFYICLSFPFCFKFSNYGNEQGSKCCARL